MKIAADMIARAHDVMDFLLHDAGFLAAKSYLMTALIVLPAALMHRVVTLRCRVMERFPALEIFRDVFGPGAEERPAHAGVPIGLPDLLMARDAGFAWQVAGVGT